MELAEIKGYLEIPAIRMSVSMLARSTCGQVIHPEYYAKMNGVQDLAIFHSFQQKRYSHNIKKWQAQPVGEFTIGLYATGS